MNARIVKLLLAAASVCCCCGCDVSLTGRLWRDGAYVVPSPTPKLVLYKTPNAILAEYDALYERGGEVRRRAYLVEPNLARVASNKKPAFVNPAKAGPLTKIPVYDRVPTVVPRPDLFAICSTNGTFTVYERGMALGPCDLPVYPEASATASRVALTPLAVTGDASVVAAVVGYVLFTDGGNGYTATADGGVDNQRYVPSANNSDPVPRSR